MGRERREGQGESGRQREKEDGRDEVKEKADGVGEKPGQVKLCESVHQGF